MDIGAVGTDLTVAALAATAHTFFQGRQLGAGNVSNKAWMKKVLTDQLDDAFGRLQERRGADLAVDGLREGPQLGGEDAVLAGVHHGGGAVKSLRRLRVCAPRKQKQTKRKRRSGGASAPPGRAVRTMQAGLPT